MTISDQVDVLQAKVTELRRSLDASQHETEEQLRTRKTETRAQARAAHGAALDQTDKAAAQGKGRAKSFKADVAAQMQELQRRINRKRAEHDVKETEQSAEWAEDYALDTLYFAGWAIDQAEAAVLEAADARAMANARGATSQGS